MVPTAEVVLCLCLFIYCRLWIFLQSFALPSRIRSRNICRMQLKRKETKKEREKKISGASSEKKKEAGLPWAVDMQHPALVRCCMLLNCSSLSCLFGGCWTAGRALVPWPSLPSNSKNVFSSLKKNSGTGHIRSASTVGAPDREPLRVPILTLGHGWLATVLARS